jgi:predicted metal-binding protein
MMKETIAKLEGILREHGFPDHQWCDPKEIVVAQWVRMKCEYGCTHYGRAASCPPNTPSVDECRRFFSEYESGLVLRFRKSAPDSDERHAWSAKTNEGLLELERSVFLAGFPKAFLLLMDSCRICADCAARRQECREPRRSRPTPEGMAVDVFTTVRRLGFPIEVLTDNADTMNRYAILLVE